MEQVPIDVTDCSLHDIEGSERNEEGIKSIQTIMKGEIPVNKLVVCLTRGIKSEDHEDGREIQEK